MKRRDCLQQPPAVQDQLNNKVLLDRIPQRIISLVPSITLTLFELGLQKRIVGRTKFCIHPADLVKEVRIIGGTKQFHTDRIHALKPDLIIANKEENEKADILELRKQYPVYVSDVRDLESNYRMIHDLGRLTDTEAKATEIVEATKRSFHTLPDLQNKPGVYFIWKNPYMVAGADTFIQHMIHSLGIKNVFKTKNGRYPEITENELKTSNPQLILLSSEPYPFKEKDMKEFKTLCPEAEILLVNGEYFSWYGSLLKDAPDYFRELFD